ncbi:purine-nucleoside phosphorylase [Enterococcus dispar]|uniref:Purine nucleoside phosphorylase n=1 Tax=Enterococcus dispar ATCC 51266 TaxID=1139219 RepID=S0K311_9ENTE|nr:purine-nucleoside phosphorylase [Enterococcus dispar]EOT38897.1 purine nucleoside phosphorylase I, inosine and guanosine-specific [Enterococcus dispar ATCC 51266]EOW86202.1 purine nucleoside phosphorylase I, inosine and guanosine-specific [Enterococcus dispar ATCC 51266]MCU7357120.1 purine-nucleoside phosphorylase [Enterococcus dispar]MDT2705225.1 purine-nucleoside phosphorylase [Enterococcus dispar]WCG32335.1 purine-nucleoside phosphorylase [Enterococcus dispar]
MTAILAQLKETTEFIKEQGVKDVEFGLILGSGLGELAEEIENPVVIPYNEIPHFPVSTVVGHAGQLVYGQLAGKKVLAMQGRFHYYEGNSMQAVTYPVRVMKELKAHSVIVTNACGGVNETFAPGDLMLITDHINFMSANPLIGPNEESMGPRFPDMSQAYTPEYMAVAKEVAKASGLHLKEGVYMGFSGPTYETPAEIRFARTIGADAVGMSTVPEVIVASHSGLKVLGISCITNLAAGMQKNLNHAEVVETTERVKAEFKALVKETLAQL